MKISYSKMSSYFNCPRKFYLDYVLKKAVYRDSIHTIYGTSIHETIQLIIKDMFNKELKSESVYIDFFIDYFNGLRGKLKSLSNLKFNEFVSYGKSVILFFYKNKDRYYGDPMYQFRDVEFEHEVEYKDNISITMKADVVIFDSYESKIIIDDLKISMRGWSDKQKKDEIKILQLLFYKFVLLFESGFDKCNDVDVRFIVFKNIAFAPKGLDIPAQRIQTIKPASGKQKMKLVKKYLDKFIDENINEQGEYIDKGIENYECFESSYCKFCEYRGGEFCSIKK